VLILASGSPRRRELLTQIGVSFTVQPSQATENVPPGTNPVEMVKELALRKAREVAGASPAHWVLGADTIVVLDGQVLGKPADAQDAASMLQRLSGRRHQVLTGVALVGPGGQWVDYAETIVWMRPLTQEEIEAYVATGEPLDKAGAYGIQGRAAAFVPRIEGCYYNVVGLPLALLSQKLHELGIES
jgi:septum formation protein